MVFTIDKLGSRASTGMVTLLLGLTAGTLSYADPITHTITENNVDFTSAGIAGLKKEKP